MRNLSNKSQSLFSLRKLVGHLKRKTKKEKKKWFTRGQPFFCIIMLFIRSFESQIGLHRVCVFVFVVWRREKKQKTIWRFNEFIHSQCVFRICRHSWEWQHWNTSPALLRNTFVDIFASSDSYGLKRKTNSAYFIYISQIDTLTSIDMYVMRALKYTCNTHSQRKQRAVYHFIQTVICTRTIRENIVLKLDWSHKFKRMKQNRQKFIHFVILTKNLRCNVILFCFISADNLWSINFSLKFVDSRFVRLFPWFF